MSSDGLSRRRRKKEVVQVKVLRRLTSHPVEMQGRIVVLGREMAKFAKSSGMLSRVQFSAHAVHRSSDQLIVRHPRTDELLNNRLLPFSPTSFTTGLCPHIFLQRPPPMRFGQPTPLHDPRSTTTIMSIIRDRRLHISLGLCCSRSRPRRVLTTSITTNNSGSVSPAGAVHSQPVFVASLPVSCPSPPASTPRCSAAGMDGRRVGGSSITAYMGKVVEY
jgi:hypothetical protein